MDLKTAAARIERSRKVIDRWERHGPPQGRIGDNLRMIGEETTALSKIGSEHVELAETTREIGRRYGDLANRIRLGNG